MYAPVGGKKSTFPQCPVGTYAGTIAAVEYVGEQSSDWEGETKISDDVLITVEVNKKQPELLLDGETNEFAGLNFAPSKQAKVSLHPKSWIRKNMADVFMPGASDTALGKVHLGSFIGQHCTVAIGVTTGGKAKITGITPAMEGLDPVDLDGDYSEPTGLAEWLRGPENRNLVDYNPSKFDKPVAEAKAEAAANAPDETATH